MLPPKKICKVWMVSSGLARCWILYCDSNPSKYSYRQRSIDPAYHPARVQTRKSVACGIGVIYSKPGISVWTCSYAGILIGFQIACSACRDASPSQWWSSQINRHRIALCRTCMGVHVLPHSIWLSMVHLCLSNSIWILKGVFPSHGSAVGMM